MSFQALRLVYATPARTATDQSVLVVVAWHAGRQPVVGEDGQLAYEAWPSVATIAREAGLRRRESARLALRRLEDDGRLLRVPATGGRTNRYRIPVGQTSPRTVVPANREGPDQTSPRSVQEPPREPGSELSVNDVCKSSSDLSTRARANGDAQLEGEEAMDELSDDERQRVRDALTVLADRAWLNEPDAFRNRLAAKAAQMVHLRDLTHLAARHPHLSPEQLASWVDYAVAIGGDADSAHDHDADEPQPRLPYADG